MGHIPPVAAAGRHRRPLFLLIGLVKLYGFWMGASTFVVPDWYRLLAELLIPTAWFVVMPLATLALTIIVWRQRLSILWLLPCLLLLLPLITDLHADFPTAAEIRQHKQNYFSVGLGWAWGIWGTGEPIWRILPGNLEKELAAGVYWGLARQLLILAPPILLLWMRHRRRLLAKVPLPS